MSESKNLNVIIMAAGKGKRMKSKTPKVLHKILEEPLLYYVLESVKKTGPKNMYVVLGHKKEEVQEYINKSFPDVKIVYQEQQLGTAHAVKSVMGDFDVTAESTLVLSADTPLITAQTLSDLKNYHTSSDADATLLTTEVEDPFGYGRIIRNDQGGLLRVIEEADATQSQKKIKEVNTSFYCFKTVLLSEYINKIKPDNKQNEYYLTDIAEHFIRDNKKVLTFQTDKSHEIFGINDRYQLSKAQKYIQREINKDLMINGVTIRDMDSVYIGPRVKVSPDTVIEPNTYIWGDSTIEQDCIIGPCVQISDSSIGKGTVINTAKIVDAQIGPYNDIGPFSYVRPQTVTAQKVKIGGFCEIKKSTIGPKSKVPHLSYIGDTEIGSDVNIGASTVTCNYNGFKKNKTKIGNNVFIGSGTMIVPPVSIEDHSMVAANSTITKDVPENALAIERAEQLNIIDGAARFRKKNESKK
jgi:bifunctional UDP-N-acetylglucosamine pyrophosphorylase / glucosamine-1-phosphate N-acetyltransferase